MLTTQSSLGLFLLVCSCKPTSVSLEPPPPPPPELSTEEALPPPPPKSSDAGAGLVPNADRVIAGLRPRFKQCYQAALNENPDVQGRTVILATVSPTGSVVSAVASETTGLPSRMVECIATVVRSATFDAPGGGGATLKIPVSYVQASDASAKPR